MTRRLVSQLKSHVQAHRHAHGASHPPPAKTAEKISITHELPVYAGSCGAMARGAFGELKPEGAVILARSADGLDLHVETSGASGQPDVGRVTSGASAAALKQALEKHAPRPARGWETRIFRVAAMHVSAVWFHRPAHPERDVFVPYTANFAGLRPGRAYSGPRVKATLKKHAMQMILRWYERVEKERSAAPPAVRTAAH